MILLRHSRRFYILIIACIHIPVLAASPPATKNQLIAFGGNCESLDRHPDLHENQFLKVMKNEISGFRAKGWAVTALFGGDQERCSVPSNDPRCDPRSDPGKTLRQCCPPGISPYDAAWHVDSIANAAGVPTSKVPVASKEALIRSLKNSLSTLESGSELLITLNTHGGPAELQHAHTICMANGSMMPVDSPEIVALFAAIKKKGVKIGIIDTSCFGGGSQELSKYGCVLTDQTQNRVSWGDLLLESLNKFLPSESENAPLQSIPYASYPSRSNVQNSSITLEDVYLDALLRNSGAAYPLLDQPQISGFRSLTSFDEAAASFLYEGHLNQDSDREFIEELNNEYDQEHEKQCRTADSDFIQLNHWLKSFAQILKESKKPQAHQDPLWMHLAELGGWGPNSSLNGVIQEVMSQAWLIRSKLDDLKKRTNLKKIQIAELKQQFNLQPQDNNFTIVLDLSGDLAGSGVYLADALSKVLHARKHIANSVTTIRTEFRSPGSGRGTWKGTVSGDILQEYTLTRGQPLPPLDPNKILDLAKISAQKMKASGFSFPVDQDQWTRNLSTVLLQSFKSAWSSYTAQYENKLNAPAKILEIEKTITAEQEPIVPEMQASVNKVQSDISKLQLYEYFKMRGPFRLAVIPLGSKKPQFIEPVRKASPAMEPCASFRF